MAIELGKRISELLGISEASNLRPSRFRDWKRRIFGNIEEEKRRREEDDRYER
jgi:hypothetical protein